MAIAAVGARGTAGIAGVAGKFIFLSPSANVAAGNYLLLAISADNQGAVDGDNVEVDSITGDASPTWTKLGEYTNSPTGVVNDGVVASLWMGLFPTGLTTSQSITVIFTTSAVADAACSAHEFSVGAGKVLALDSGPVSTEVNAANGFGSAAISGLSSLARLYFRAMGKEKNTTAALTPSTGFTAIANARSRNNANAMTVYGEFRLNTSTGETSNPTLAQSGDTASVFVALKEVSVYSALVAGQGSFTLTGENAALTAHYVLTAAAGSFALTGQAANLTGVKNLLAASGTFTLTGQSANLIASHVLTADYASFSLTGEDAGLIASHTMAAAQGSFAMTGQAASLVPSRLLTADTAEFFLTGNDVNFFTGTVHTLVAATGTFTLTGEAAGFLVNHVIDGETGIFELDGQDADFLRELVLPTAFGSFALAGQDAGFMATRMLTAGYGAFALTGEAMTFHYGRIYASDFVAIVPAVMNRATVPALMNTATVPAVNNTATA